MLSFTLLAWWVEIKRNKEGLKGEDEVVVVEEAGEELKGEGKNGEAKPEVAKAVVTPLATNSPVERDEAEGEAEQEKGELGIVVGDNANGDEQMAEANAANGKAVGAGADNIANGVAVEGGGVPE